MRRPPQEKQGIGPQAATRPAHLDGRQRLRPLDPLERTQPRSAAAVVMLVLLLGGASRAAARAFSTSATASRRRLLLQPPLRSPAPTLAGFLLPSSPLRGKHSGGRARRPQGGQPPSQRRPQAAASAEGGGEQPAAGEGAAGETDMPFASSYHAPVMWQEVLEYLVVDPHGSYLDCTLGGGGHSAAIISKLDPTGPGRVVALDQDPDALAFATRRLAAAADTGRFRALRANFRSARAVVEAEGCLPPGGFTGMLLDLGVSSHQLDEASRGFSFRGDGPLDMRMQGGTGGQQAEAEAAPTGLTAADIVNTWEVGALSKVLKEYGEEPRAYKLARAMVAARPLDSTAALRAVVEQHTPYADRPKTLARVFQGLRIAVNGEMEALASVLTQATALVRPGGRLVVLSYHSLEDRPVKRFMRSGTLDGEVRRDFYGHALSTWRPLTRASLRPTEAEVAANARARSVSMRVAERTDMSPEEVAAKVGAPPELEIGGVGDGEGGDGPPRWKRRGGKGKGQR